MRLRWVPLFENYPVGDILSSEELRRYRKKQGDFVYEPPPKPVKKVAVIKAVKQKQIFTPTKRAKIYARDNGMCWLCGLHVSVRIFSIDHVIPLSKGGTNNLSNLRLAHKDCNSIKSDHPIESKEDFFNLILTTASINKGAKRKLTEFEKAALAHKANGTHPA